MPRQLAAKEMYLLIPEGGDWYVFKYKGEKIKASYHVDGSDICPCKGSFHNGDSCRHVQMIKGDFYYTNSKKDPYTLGDVLAWKMAQKIAKNHGAVRWTVFGDLADDNKTIVKRIDVLAAVKNSRFNDGWQSYGFLRLGDTGVSVRIIFCGVESFDLIREVLLLKGVKV